MKIRETKKKHARRLWLFALAAAVLLPVFTALAADGDVKADHGAVKIRNYDYDKLVQRLSTKYPGIFKTANVYSASSRRNIGSTSAIRVLITTSKNHRSSGNSGTTVKYISGSSRSTSNWGVGLGSFESKEYFTVNGEIGYCFDWTTPSAAGQHLLSASLSDAGITVGTGANVMELAQAARMLTQNNYALIVQKASAIAKGLAIPAFTNPDYSWMTSSAVSIAKSDVETLLKDTTADGIAFKRALVQMLVWGKMNAISYGDWLYSLTADSGYYDKEGNWVDQGEPIITSPIIGYAGIIDFDQMYEAGREAWEEQSESQSVDYEYQYELTVGVPFTIPSADTGRVLKIIEANGGRIEAGRSVAVNISGDRKTVTLTASQALPEWTDWLSASESSSMIYSSKPYAPSASGSTGRGQFIVAVSEMKYMRARVKAVMPTGTLTITKSSADPRMTDGNACYSLAGARYGIYTDSACTTPAKDAGGNDAVLITAASGTSNTVTLDTGTYYVREISPSPGYGLAAGTYPVTIARDEARTLSAADSSVFAEPPLNDPMALFIRKTAAKAYGASDFDMSGAQYTVRWYAGQYTKQTLPAEADAVWVIETKKTGSVYAAYLADGYVVSGSPVYGTNAGGGYVIPLGTLTVEETKAPAGFTIEGSTLQLMNGNGSDAADGVVLFNLVDQSSAVSVISGNQTDDTEEGIQILQKETVSAANVKLVKTSDDGEVSGISFTLSGTMTAGGTYRETRTTDADGVIDFGELPYGSYTLSEDLTKEQAAVYAANDPLSFTIDENTADPYTVTFRNRLQRGSLSFTKILERTGKALAYVPFRITNSDTNEVHYVITGADGRFDSERGTHSVNTNGADAALSQYVPDTDIVPDAVIDALAAAGADAYGVWFGPGTADDAEKALPAGHYRIEEMKTERTKTLVMQDLSFVVERGGQIVDLGTVTNGELRISTAAADAATGTHSAFAGPDAKIVDSVSYSGAKAGGSYTVKGELMLIGPDGTVSGSGITASRSFTAEASSGTVRLEFSFDASALAGRKAVVYETLLTAAGQFAAEHRDPEDAAQIVSFAKITTAAKDTETGIGISEADGSVTIVDSVSYENLAPGTAYTLKGELYDKSAGALTGITAQKNFTPSAASGTVELRFSFDASALAGKVLAAFETVSLRDHIIAEHRDPDDDAQTVYLPKIGTVLADSASGTHLAAGSGTVTLTDTVTYTNLRPGRTYTLQGELMNKATGESTGIRAGKSFMPRSASGTETLTFTFDAGLLSGTEAVAFERIFCNGAEVAVHADINDPDQTVCIPGIDTTAAAADTNDHVGGASGQLVIIDRVDYAGLEAGRKYSLRGELYDKESGESLGIAAEDSFTAEASEGYRELTFTFDASLLAGKTVVAFETLYAEEKEAAAHHDIDDEDQSVHIPGIGTDAADAESGLNHVEAKANAAVADTVTYTNLVPGREYRVKGILMDKDAGEPLLAGGREVTAETVFTPDAADGSVQIIFGFDASRLGGKTLVAFETLYFGDVPVAVHADPDDERQTIFIPAISTEAKNDATGNHEGTESPAFTVTDSVTYVNLIPGKVYTVRGILMDKASGEPLLAGGKQILSEKTFTPETADGTVELSFTFNARKLGGKTAVVFETLYCEGTEVAVHADIEDRDQAIVFPDVSPSAGDPSDIMIPAAVMLAAGLGIAVIGIVKKRT